ncbi:MAG TPA: hypothetical protein VHG72_10405 [Polyangia bacterium]|nr:hypothetical protein [Polyangia bacterium]
MDVPTALALIARHRTAEIARVIAITFTATLTHLLGEHEQRDHSIDVAANLMEIRATPFAESTGQ